MALHWGIAGVGMITHDFLTALCTLPNKEHQVVAIAGTLIEKTDEMAKLHRIKTSYDSYKALAEDPLVEIVFVGVVYSEHYEVAHLMLEHGKHVLCEKPMCLNHHQTGSLVKLARAKNLFLMEGMWSRFFPAYDVLDKHLSSGGLGDVYQLNVQFGVQISDVERMLMKDLGGGTILDLGMYMLQFAQFVFRCDPSDIVCAGHLTEQGMDESITCILKYPEGKTATLVAHTRVTLNNEAEIIGTKGSVVLEQFWCPTILQTSQANITEWQLPKGRFRFNFHNSAGLSYEAEECRKCIREGLTESPKMTLDESVLLAEMADKLRTMLGVKFNQEI